MNHHHQNLILEAFHHPASWKSQFLFTSYSLILLCCHCHSYLSHRKILLSASISSVQSLSHVRFCNPMDCSMPGFPVHDLPRARSNSSPLSQWCHPNISFSVVPFSSCLQFFPASGSFPVSQFFPSGGQRLELQYQSFQWIFRTDFI